MAAKRRDPTVAGQKQLDGKLKNILGGKLEFISAKNMQNWYGRYDDVAVDKLNVAWKAYWKANSKSTARPPQLFAFGPIAKLDGYAVCRADQKGHWSH